MMMMFDDDDHDDEYEYDINDNTVPQRVNCILCQSPSIYSFITSFYHMYTYIISSLTHHSLLALVPPFYLIIISIHVLHLFIY